MRSIGRLKSLCTSVHGGMKLRAQTHSFTLIRQYSNSSEDPVKIIVDLRSSCTGSVELKKKLEHCGVAASPELVVEILSRFRNDWESAFTFFLWAGKQQPHSAREYHSMISILGKMRKFDTAWALIDEMRRPSGSSSTLVTPQTLLLMIRKYSCARHVGKAIHTFYSYKRFAFEAGMDDFHGLLSALCRYKNVPEAEHLLFCNSHVFPFNTKSFNIVLNGWANIIGSPRNADRVWAEMISRGVPRDAISYSCLISCHSKCSNLTKVLTIFRRMEKFNVEPDTKVYNALIYALGKAGHLKEAANLMNTMQEKGLAPNIVTYNSLIKTLCKAKEIDQAKHILYQMMEQRGLVPTIQTYHPFFRVVQNEDQVFELLEKMKSNGCPPSTDTYIMLIRKFCRWGQLDNVFKVWSEMSENGPGPDRSSYIVLIHGLFLNGKMEEAHKYYTEMKDRHYLPEPRTEEMLQAWLSGKQASKFQTTDGEIDQVDSTQPATNTKLVISRKSHLEKDFLRQPESRKVVRERGFSFWEQ
ncbi:pentatricopeptide repeat-containing protein At5g15010, mitochondrial [Argentina anserina]|uniref:pentatricopeptide repeat-containing protein At5g15010, mitochondrial n=1 Tax=Argentina anserina TaxID=57926 RepID=UPI00217664A3|nr:pentatricopeptide repeat-containing protein At5g15010, mitochondrial [Potentilla anserina]XP_050365935.1 pentatricopeptide repeat-containing protein At5g15010, mitochondrial [Potentilla anserina]XP_050365941.1 pentatricopeptide repeat-containing protein At5g15010, mitochondrial [Potentilla anserina]XP_050365948.1 pentatricopeptide repeat-containing protein At5g15010, mitochondrial [Potentilla anserina]XP_050365956.1 pentatricopeptide repeat-containing protein At5g15010, mitochondrial [Potent